MAPAVLSMKAGFQLPSTDTAVKPASVTPAEKGCLNFPLSFESMTEVISSPQERSFCLHI